VGVQQPALPSSAQLPEPRENGAKNVPRNPERHPSPPTLVHWEGVEVAAWPEAAGSARQQELPYSEGCPAQQLNNSTKLWARGSCHGSGTPGHRFLVEDK